MSFFCRILQFRCFNSILVTSHGNSSVVKCLIGTAMEHTWDDLKNYLSLHFHCAVWSSSLIHKILLRQNKFLIRQVQLLILNRGNVHSFPLDFTLMILILV